MPTTLHQHEKSLHQPAMCELLPVRDFLDGFLVRTNGAFVAGYELGGLHSYYHDDEARNRTKNALEALVRSLPERSVRLQVRYEVTEGLGDLRDRYKAESRSAHPVVQALERERLEGWAAREASGWFLRPVLHAFVCWDPRIHHEPPDRAFRLPLGGGFSVSRTTCLQRSRQEHETLVAEANSLLTGVEQALHATGMGVRRLTDDELFCELKRALNPLLPDTLPLRAVDTALRHRSPREQAANTSIEEEAETYLRVGGLLHSVISLKDLPDATYPGLLRELVSLDFPLVVNAEVSVPDQARAVAHYKSRMRRMMAAQRDTRGGFRVNIDAQVAQEQLMTVLRDIIASSLKTCKVSLVVGVRTSRPVQSRRDLEAAERELADRRQRVLHAILRMNGARAVPEDLAKRRLYLAGLPGCAEENKREHDCLTVNAADLLPVETPWQGTPRSPLILLETPYRQLVPFSPFDPSLSDANVLVMAKSGGGKTFLVQKLLMELARANACISILERGDSYQPLVELMGGRVVAVSLDGHETLNPWDLPAGERTPSKQKIAFLKNLTRHMLGESRHLDNSLLDNVLTEAIARTYKRLRVKFPDPTPTFSDLYDELANYQDEQRMQQLVDEAKIASIKLREWVGEKGVYAKLFDQKTTLRTDSNWLFFNVEGLAADPKLEAAMSLLIANAMAERASGRTGQLSITVLDECWFLLDSPVLAPEVVQLFRTARKRNSSVWGISQTVEDFVGTSLEPKRHGPGIIKNASTRIVGPQPGDTGPLAQHLALNEVAVGEIKRLSAPRKGKSAEALLVIGEKAEMTQVVRILPTPVEYWVSTTFARERAYRKWLLRQRPGQPAWDAYQELAGRYPQGLAEVDPLPEERSGAVNAVWDERGREARNGT